MKLITEKEANINEGIYAALKVITDYFDKYNAQDEKNQ